MKKIKVSLTGVGGYGKIHYNLLKEYIATGKLELSAVVIRPQSREKYAETIAELEAMNCRIFPSDEALLQEFKPDLAILPIGIPSHRPVSCLYLQHNVNVLLEKPAAGSVSDVDEMIAAGKKSSGRLAVAFQDMYSDSIRNVKRRILSGEFGKLKSVTMMGLWLRPDSYYQRNGWSGRICAADGSKIYDSPINNAFAHFLNDSLFCAGSEMWRTATPTAVQGEIFRVRPELETFDVCSMRFIANGIPIVTLMSHVGKENFQPQIRFKLEKGSILWVNNGTTKVFSTAGEQLEETRNDDSRHSMYDRIFEWVNDPSKPIYTLQDARNHTLCIEKLHEFCPIQLPPPELVSRKPEDGQYALAGIEELWKRGFEESKLISECGISWSKPMALKEF